MKGKLRILAVLAVLAGTASTGFGAGFALIEQSVSGLGNAFAGGAAGGEDASTVFFNPAGMSRLNGVQGIAGLHYIMPSAKFKNEGSTHLLQAYNPAAPPLQGGNGGEGGEAALAPNLYLTAQVSDTVTVGLGINAPFGMGTDYEKNWVGRYHAIKSEMKTVNINPAVSFKLSDVLSLGLGVNAQYLSAELSNAIDFGTLDAVGYFAPLPAGALGLTPQNSDGYVTLDGDSWAYGVNAGLLLSFTPESRLGLAYRQGISHDVEGTADFITPAQLAPVQAATGFFTDSDVTAVADLPDTYSASLYHRFSPLVAVMADATLTKWSAFKELRFKFANGQPDGVTTENWEDSWRYSLGTTINPSEALALRAGVAFDQTPIPNAEYRTPRIPGEDRTWVTLGAGYQITKAVAVNVAYAHLFVKDPKIAKSLASSEDAIRGGLTGTYDASVDIASAELLVKF